MKTKTKIKTKVVLLKIAATLLTCGMLSPLLLLLVLPLHYSYPILEALQSIGIMILCILMLGAGILCGGKAKDLQEELRNNK